MVGYMVIFLRSLVNHAFVEKTFLNRVIHASQTFKDIFPDETTATKLNACVAITETNEDAY